MAHNRMRFTKSSLLALKPLADKVVYCYDTEIQYLRIGIHPTGKRTFGLLKKHRGRVITLPLGEFPYTTIFQARQQASKKLAQLARGENLLETESPTLGQFFERYAAERPRARAVFDRYLKRWQNRPLGEIRRADVERLHREISQPVITATRRLHGPVAANRLLNLLSNIFNKARDWGIDVDNPVRGVKRTPEFPRSRVLSRDGEFQKFRDALNTEKNPDLRLYLKIRLFNGVRGNNILAMRWEDLDLDARTWQISKTKSGAPLQVPLAPAVVEELRKRSKELKDGSYKSEWVFPGHRRGTHRTTVAREWRRFRNNLKLRENIELRDLRRTFASYALWSGVPPALIGNLMGHAPGSRITSVVYAHPDEQLRREAITTVEKKMLHP
jgi:integrase